VECLCALRLLERRDSRGRPYIRRSELARAVEVMPGLGKLVEKLIELGALVEERAGRGSRYLVLLDKIFTYLLEEAIRTYAGPTGYAPLDKVASFVTSRMEITREEFEAMLREVVYNVKKFALTEGGIYRVKVGSRSYGFIKLISPSSLGIQAE